MNCPQFEYQNPATGIWTREFTPPSPHFNFRGRFKVQVIDARTKRVVHERPWQKNLILDAGLDKVATINICDLFRYAAAGTGNTPTDADSSGITQASQSGTTVTLTSSWGEMAVNRLIRWDTGQEAKIVSGSGTSWTVDRSQTVAQGDFRIFRVEQTGLTSEVSAPAGAGRTGTLLLGTGNCETTRSGSIFTHKRTYDFLSPTSNTNYAEVGVSDISTAGANLFSRMLISGGTVTVLSTQQLRLIYVLTVTASPTSPNSKTASITGWPVSPATDTAGTEQLNSASVSSIRLSDGLTEAFNAISTSAEPAGAGQVFISNDSTAHPTWPADLGRAGSPTAPWVEIDTNTYTNGSFLKDKSGEFAANAANATNWRGVGFGRASPNINFPYQSGFVGLYFLFGQAQTKQNTHRLRLTFRWTWARDLS